MTEILFQCLLGIQCKDFVMVAADQTLAQSVILLKTDSNKLHEVSDRILIGLNGNLGDTTQFAQFVSKNAQLYRLKNQYGLNTACVTHFARTNMLEALHKGTPNMLNIVVAGYDDQDGCQLYTMDFLAACLRVPYAAHGLGGYLSWGILDHYYRPDLSEKNAYEVLMCCVREVQLRLFMNLANFQVKTITKDGVKVLPTICSASLQ
ncbi:PREDICTED: proteasome subunit beta type-2-like [Papilio xuthus]|uniref:Proteasome subunit beta n=1 Tax=Papilio xuthus TaxID=66420 RepID=A0A194Q5N8_PAPXU|nr:PREDICTED: proteasome subunit beta type-2-like [Papilio xuthus]KPJ00320.1 Proteasome subunit beta type-2 [Papilio xuthus]